MSVTSGRSIVQLRTSPLHRCTFIGVVPGFECIDLRKKYIVDSDA